jgi:hypothetical protein
LFSIGAKPVVGGMTPVHPRLRVWLEFADLFGEAAEIGYRELQRALRSRRHAAYATIRPGSRTPLWNLLVLHLRAELGPFGSKVRLARHLGIPKQRLTDFLTGRRRMPDAELTLRLLHWLTEKRAGRDPSL